MTSDTHYTEAYVWCWLPGATGPVVAGRLADYDGRLQFNYGQRYLAYRQALSLYEPELPLRAGRLPLLKDLNMPGCLRDAAPDAWGRRVLINRKLGLQGEQAAAVQLGELTYLLESGSDRIGALDFQLSPTEYVPRLAGRATLAELLAAAERVEKGVPLTAELDQALRHGSSIGGARPKALLDAVDAKLIAKFSTSSDLYSVVKAEFIAMRLAALIGLQVAPVRLEQVAGKEVLLIERFDRIKAEAGWQRRALVSALTLFELHEMQARYASYQDLAELIRRRFTDPAATLRELFGRLVFNILCGNTDDHARNHAAFWDGRMLTLTPAYDICPQSRSGNEASQAMLINGNDNLSRLSGCLQAAHHFLLSEPEALQLMQQQLQTIGAHWLAVCEEAGLSATDRRLLWGRTFLNPFAFDDLGGEARALQALATQVRASGSGDADSGKLRPFIKH
jgi:serine/threonine-protein kinase HipA